MNDTQQQDNWDDEQVEIVDLPGQAGDPAAYQKPIMRLQQRASAPILLWAIRIGIVMMVCLLIYVILLQTPLLSLSRNNATQPSAKPAQTSITGISAENGYAFVNSSDGSIAAYHADTGQLAWRVHLGTAVTYTVVSSQAIYCFLTNGNYGLVEALRASDGKLLWTDKDTFTGQVWMMAKDGNVYLNSELGIVYAVRGSDGQALWHFDAGMPMPFNGFLTEDNGLVSVQTSASTIFVLRASDGTVIYHYQSLLSLQNTVLPIVQNGIIYIVSTSGFVQARSSSNGGLLWQHIVAIGAGAWTPTVLGGTVYVYDTASSSILALNGQNGRALWRYQSQASLRQPVVSNGAVYLTSLDDQVIALRGVDGTVLWRTKLPASAVMSGSAPVIDNTIIYINLAAPGGMIYALQASDGRVLWQHTLFTNTTVYAPVVNDGILYLGKDAFSIDAWRGSDGRFLWHYTAPAQITWYPEVLDGIMYVLPFNGTMDVLRIDNGTRLWHFPFQA